VEIIPVLDLLHGKVVRAHRGERNRYLPIRSTLCDSCEPHEVVRALTELYPFKSLYIADLNAIQGIANNSAAISMLLRDFPQIDFWLDIGIANASSWPFPDAPNIRCVIGSETLSRLEQYLQLSLQLSANRPILSLDFNQNGFMGPDSLLQSEHWPEALLCMTLTKVGSYEGPDFEKIAELSAMDRHRKVYAAGGVRHVEDLMRLQCSGATGALIASTLHDGKIDARQIAELMA
jgi:phosphoribosylformimino-5-aminoimidazole carboxamide ribotide isomerase